MKPNHVLIGAIVLLPEKGHRLHNNSPYWWEPIRNYFREHLNP